MSQLWVGLPVSHETFTGGDNAFVLGKDPYPGFRSPYRGSEIPLPGFIPSGVLPFPHRKSNPSPVRPILTRVRIPDPGSFLTRVSAILTAVSPFPTRFFSLAALYPYPGKDKPYRGLAIPYPGL